MNVGLRLPVSARAGPKAPLVKKKYGSDGVLACQIGMRKSLYLETDDLSAI